ncbi:MAG: extracytoplasmic sigma factor ECF [Planctomycetota bacterium]|nr:MAG: extracytoplasmic sigma factor ECF [Planctomycetota bacterium]
MSKDATHDEVNELLARLGAGEEAASEQLFPLLYAELRRMASSAMRNQRSDHTLQPTALVHEAYMKLASARQQEWSGRPHFFAVAAKAMRQILVDYGRASQAKKRGGEWQKVTLAGAEPSGSDATVDIVALHDALEDLAKQSARKARIVELRFFAGLGVDETAAILGVSRRTVLSDWRVARAWLATALDGFKS